jgi:hypothetical protein
MQRKTWVAKETKKEDPVKAMQAKITKLEKTIKNGGANKDADKTCFHCRKKGHISPNCPDKDKEKVPAPQGEQNKDDKSKNKPKSAVRTPPKEGEAQTKTVDGVTMKWCQKCGRWTKGDKLHSTEEHKPKGERGNGETNHGAGQAAATAGTAGLRLVSHHACCFGCPIGDRTQCHETGCHSLEKCPRMKKKEEAKRNEKEVRQSATYAQKMALDHLERMTSKGQAGPDCL